MILLWLYGMALIAAPLVFLRYLQLAVERLRSPHRPTFGMDVFALVRTGSALLAGGLVAGFAQRLGGTLGADLFWLHALAIVLIVPGLAMLLRAGALNDRHWAWHGFLVLGLTWTLAIAAAALR